MNHNLTKYITGLLLFGSNGVVASFIDLPSHDIVFWRSVLGGFLLTALFFLSRNRITCHHHRKDLLFVILSGAAMAADWLLLFEAYSRIGVSLGMIINYCGPVIVVLFSAFLFKEKITNKTIFALAFALTGAILISWQGVNNGIDRSGLIFAVLSAFAYAAMVITNKLSKEIRGTENATIQLLSAMIIVAVYVIGKHGVSFTIPSGSILPILWIGLLNTGLGCYFYFSSLSPLPAQTVAVFGYIEPLSAVLFSVLILQERMMLLQITGAALILIGTMILNFSSPHDYGRKRHHIHAFSILRERSRK